MHVVVMGVSGSGKTTVGERLAEELGLPYGEADDFHPPENVEKMRGGHPLDDADREPWLAAIAAWTREHEEGGQATVVTCSALKRAYRDVLRTGGPTYVVHLHGTREVLEQRLAGREGHFMPGSLLDSQLDTLEPLGADEPGVVVDIDQPIEQVVGESVRVVRRAADDQAQP